MHTYFVTRRSRQIKRIFFMYIKFIIRTFTSHISFPVVDRKHAFSRIYDLRGFFPRRSVRIFFPIFRTTCKRKAVKNDCEVILKSTCSRIFSANSTLAGFPLFHALAIIYMLIPLEIKKDDGWHIRRKLFFFEKALYVKHAVLKI